MKIESFHGKPRKGKMGGMHYRKAPLSKPARDCRYVIKTSSYLSYDST